jgi:diguanylate cyclase (GGDEF)-like protein
MDSRPEKPQPQAPRWTRGEAIYACVLFAAAWLLVGTALARGDALPQTGSELGAAAFFFVYGLFTISIGYQHPNLGYYSFDRVSQVASVLVLGPVQAALVNGLASFVYPWHRVFKGVPVRDALLAALNNSGLMATIVLAAGTAYTAIGGDVPLTTLHGSTVIALLVLVLGMQILNDLGMLALFVIGRRNLTGFFHAFSYALELGSGTTAVLVALIYNTMATEVLVLTLVVLSLGMLALRQFADMRQRLEVIVAERTQKLEEKTRELERQATRDNLTGLFNRRYADEYLARELERCKRERARFAIALADIDLFKRVNDMHSHATGDAVLRHVATTLSERCRASDLLARYGGEEFLLCFPDTDLREARLICEELRGAVESCNWAQHGLAAGVTISFGIAEYRGDPSPERLLDRADVRLYEAKNRGRNLVVA